MSKLSEIQARITSWVIEALRDGTADRSAWRAPWHQMGNGGVLAPKNYTTGQFYTGGNIFALAASALDADYSDHRWATYKQWQTVGTEEAPVNVRKGEHGTTCVRWVPVDRKKGDPDSGKHLVPVGFTLFNVAQVDGIADPTADLTPTPTLDEVEDFFEAQGSTINWGGDRAFWNPITDTIGMPHRDAFHSTEGLYATLGHEHVHWTGAISRLDRIAAQKKAQEAGATRDQTYAAEELVAELGAAFLCARLGITNEPRVDHAHYIESWLSALEGDDKLLWKASKDASSAVEWLVAKSEEAATGAPEAAEGVLV